MRSISPLRDISWPEQGADLRFSPRALDHHFFHDTAPRLALDHHFFRDTAPRFKGPKAVSKLRRTLDVIWNREAQQALARVWQGLHQGHIYIDI